MVCPKCATIIDDNCDKCFNCSMEFKHSDEIQEVVKATKNKKIISPEKAKRNKIIKIVLISVAAVAVIISIIVLINILLTPDGLKISQKLGENIGQSIVVAEKNAKVHLSDKSQSAAINNQADFDYIYESNDMIKVDGVRVPKWTIKISMKEREVFSVYYRNYADQKNYYKGKKLDGPVNASDISVGMNSIDVANKFKASPTSITYYENQIDYCYVYYFINQNKDEERRGIIISFGRDSKVSKVTEIELSKFYNNYL